MRRAETPIADELRAIIIDARHLPRAVEEDLHVIARRVSRLEQRRPPQSCPECGSGDCPKAWAWPNRCERRPIRTCPDCRTRYTRRTHICVARLSPRSDPS